MTATHLRRFHLTMTLGWAALIPISVLTPLRVSVSWVVLMSAYANFVTHFDAWQSARVEAKQDEATR